MSIIINRAYQIEGFTILVYQRCWNHLKASIWLDATEDQPTFEEIIKIMDNLKDRFNTKQISLDQTVFNTNHKRPVNLTNFL